MATILKDLGPLTGSIVDVLKGELIEIYGEAVTDLADELEPIAARMALAARRQRFDLVEAGRDQLALLIEQHKLNVLEGRENMVDHLFNLVFPGIFTIASSALRGLKIAP